MDSIDKFVDAIIESDNDFHEMDRFYLKNRILDLIGDNNQTSISSNDILKLKDELLKTAIYNQKIVDNPKEIEILEARLMDFLTPLPSKINQKFWNLYQGSPKKATDYFYHLSCQNDSVKTQAIAKNIVYTTSTQYGDLEITINLAKPEKDPKKIASNAHSKKETYPQCVLCMENEGYSGRIDYPARTNHRIIRFPLGGEIWGLQYSPYAYFDEHAIFISQKHRPMVINRHTFNNLVELVKQFPDYFIGSNADLPIVGGSLLSHDHYQGGLHTFPMMSAHSDRKIDFPIDGVTAGIVKWPMSTIRLISLDPEKVVDAANLVYNTWKNYSDESIDIKAYTGKVSHHSVTPIAYKKEGHYCLDIILRDNQTSKKYPDGIFHPHQEYQHIKKENIGLIEAMGRAILPGRLKNELIEVKKYLLNEPNKMKDYHKAWADALKLKYQFNQDNVDDIIKKETGIVFEKVLDNAGVFKWNKDGQKAFDRFIKSL